MHGAVLVGAALGAALGPLAAAVGTRLPRDQQGRLTRRLALASALSCALLWAVIAARSSGALEAVPWLFLAWVAVAATIVDVRTHRLPDLLVLPTSLVGVALIGLAAVGGGEPASLARAVAAGALLSAAYLCLALPSKGGLGLGDVKLAFLVGTYLGWLGWEQVLLGTFLSFALGALVGIAVALRRRSGLRTPIPFGPFMLAGPLLLAALGSPGTLPFV